MGPQGQLAAELVSPDRDAEELAEITQRFRAELLELDVEAVELAAAGESPEGSKGLGVFTVAGLVVRFALKTSVLKSIVDGTVNWLQRQQVRSVKLTLDGDTLEVSGLSSDAQDRLIEVWVARHADDH